MSSTSSSLISLSRKFISNNDIVITESTNIIELQLDSISILEFLFAIETQYRIVINIYTNGLEMIENKSIKDISLIVDNLTKEQQIETHNTL